MNPGLIALIIVFGAIAACGLVAEHRRHTTDAEAQRRAALTSLPPLSNGWSPRGVLSNETREDGA